MTPEAATQAATLDTLDALMAGLRAGASKTAPIAVPVPELGGAVHVAPMTTTEWLDPEATSLPASASDEHRRGWNVARWVCDAQGRRLIAPDNTDALALFAALPWEASRRILVAAGVMHEGEPKNG